MDAVKRINCGYEIIEAVRVSEKLEFVTAACMCNPSSFVIWGCTNGNNYFWGRYFINRERALADMYTRAAEEMDAIKGIKVSEHDFLAKLEELKEKYASQQGWEENGPYWWEDDKKLYEAECYAYSILGKTK